MCMICIFEHIFIQDHKYKGFSSHVKLHAEEKLVTFKKPLSKNYFCMLEQTEPTNQNISDGAVILYSKKLSDQHFIFYKLLCFSPLFLIKGFMWK